MSDTLDLKVWVQVMVMTMQGGHFDAHDKCFSLKFSVFLKKETRKLQIEKKSL